MRSSRRCNRLTGWGECFFSSLNMSSTTWLYASYYSFTGNRRGCNSLCQTVRFIVLRNICCFQQSGGTFQGIFNPYHSLLVSYNFSYIIGYSTWILQTIRRNRCQGRRTCRDYRLIVDKYEAHDAIVWLKCWNEYCVGTLIRTNVRVRTIRTLASFITSSLHTQVHAVNVYTLAW